MLTIIQCRQIAARIWCDREYSHVVMHVDLAEKIGQMLYDEAKSQENRPAKDIQQLVEKLGL